MLGDRFILFGEWLYARHSVHYRRLPHYFFEFDVYDKQEGGVPRAWTTRLALLEGTGIQTVPVFIEGSLTRKQLDALIGPSQFDGPVREPADGTDRRPDGGALPAYRGRRRRHGSGEVRAARVRREGQTERLTGSIRRWCRTSSPRVRTSGHEAGTELSNRQHRRRPAGPRPSPGLRRWQRVSRMPLGTPRGTSGRTRRWSCRRTAAP